MFCVKVRWNDIHPTAKIGDDPVILPWDFAGHDIAIGSRCQINSCFHIGKGCKIRDDCNFNPACGLTQTWASAPVHGSADTDALQTSCAKVCPQCRYAVAVGSDAIFGLGALIRGRVRWSRDKARSDAKLARDDPSRL